MASTPLSSPCDVPIVVRDRRRKGFFTIDNELLDRYGGQLKAHGLAVYMALARFANQDGACWPSLSTIAKRTGVSRPQVIREIAKLKALHLIAVEHQQNDKGEYSSNIYTLLDLSAVPAESGVVSDSNQGSISQTPPLVSAGDHRSISQTPKQYPVKKTQNRKKTQRTSLTPVANITNTGDQLALSSVVVASSSFGQELVATPPQTDLEQEEVPDFSFVEQFPIPPIPGDPPSPSDDAKLEAEQELITIGISQPVAHRLATHYSAERIAEKIAYLRYLQKELPETVKHPTGWLRRAIEKDYPVPDGYLTEQDRWAEIAQIMDERHHWQEEEQEHQQQETAVQLHASYGTTQREIDLWNQLLEQFQLDLPAATFVHVATSQLLSLQDGKALIGLSNQQARAWIENRLTRKIERFLSSCHGGQPVAVTFVELSAA